MGYPANISVGYPTDILTYISTYSNKKKYKYKYKCIEVQIKIKAVDVKAILPRSVNRRFKIKYILKKNF